VASYWLAEPIVQENGAAYRYKIPEGITEIFLN
jgi:hypothetical protein